MVFNILTHVNINNSFFYLDRKEGDALEFMSAMKDNSAVLSLYRIGNYIPAYTDQKVFLGHFNQTPDYYLRIKEAEKFFLSDNQDKMKKFLTENKIGYVYLGLEENLYRRKNNIESAIASPFLQLIYQNGYISIYKVI